MFTCVLSDSGLSYSAETVQDVSEKLHKNLTERFHLLRWDMNVKTI